MEAPEQNTEEEAKARVEHAKKIVKAAQQKAKETGKPINLSGADLRGADLTEVWLWDADLRGAHLEGADLKNAHMDGANLTCANLTCANMEGANFWQTAFWGATLTHLKWGGLDCEVIALCHFPLFVVFTKKGLRFHAGLLSNLTKSEMLARLNKALKKEPLTPRLEAQSFIHAIENFEPKAKEQT